MEKINKKVSCTMTIIDFSNCPLSDRNLEYAGRAGEKEGLFITMNIGFKIS